MLWLGIWILRCIKDFQCVLQSDWGVYGSFHFFTSLPVLGIVHLTMCQLDGFEGIPHVILIVFSKFLLRLFSFLVLIGHLHFLFCELPVHVLCTFFNWWFQLFFLLICRNVVYFVGGRVVTNPMLAKEIFLIRSFSLFIVYSLNVLGRWIILF